MNLKDFKVLEDKKDNKVTDWKGKKMATLELAESYKRLGERENIYNTKFKNKAKRVRDCGDFLEFRLTTDEILKLSRANFCKVRLCSMCAWRRSLKVFGQVSRVMDYLDENENYNYLFLTLTVKNVYGNELKNTLDLMTKSFDKLSRRKQFKSSIKGYFRSLEITYNKLDNSYHPHFHLILAVNSSYFTDKDYYISQASWTDLWKSCLNVDYSPIIDIRKIKKNNKKEISEVAKYTVKSTDYLIKDKRNKIIEDLTDEIVEILDKALHRKRLISFGFKFKEIHKLLNLDDVEDGNLIDTDNKELREDLTDLILRYQWNIGIKNYELVEVVQDYK